MNLILAELFDIYVGGNETRQNGFLNCKQMIRRQTDIVTYGGLVWAER
jgi:hypothetical protein